MAKKNPNLPYIVVGVIGVLAIVGGAAFVVHNTKVQRIAEAKMWTADGPPCLELTEAEFAAQKMELKHTFAYDGLTLMRAYGAAECTGIYDDGGKGVAMHQVCSFGAPGVVRAKTGSVNKIYQAKFAQPVTLSYQDGKFSCVLAAPGR